MIFKALRTSEVFRFGDELADFMMKELAGSMHTRDAKFARKAEHALHQAARRVQDFKAEERLNVYKKAKLANHFLWRLKDAGCPPAYADELTEWLTMQL